MRTVRLVTQPPGHSVVLMSAAKQPESQNNIDRDSVPIPADVQQFLDTF